MSVPDPDVYCAVANAGFDFTWIEMQHSPLTYQDVARMVLACRGAAAIPFIRVPDATEGDIQKAADLGALGIIVPMVDTVEKAENGGAVREVSAGGPAQPGRRPVRRALGRHVPADGQRQHDGRGHDREPGRRGDRRAGSPRCRASTSCSSASTDLGSFSGLRQGDPKYEAIVTGVARGDDEGRG